MNIYFGDLHNHCNISYGFGSLHNALEEAENHLDFCAVTGHAHWPDIFKRNEDTGFIIDFHREGFEKLKSNWEAVTKIIAEANKEGAFVTFQSYEMHSSKYGDHHFISPDDKLHLKPGDSPREVIDSHKDEVIAIPHHIAYTPGYRGIDWDNFDEEISPVVEVYSKHGCGVSSESAGEYLHTMGPRDGRNTVYNGLRLGKHFSFVASTDHHAGYPGSYGDGVTAVLADELTRIAIWKALLMGRTYALTGDRIRCDFTVDGKPMGSKLSKSDCHKIKLDVRCVDYVEKAVIYKNLVPIKAVYREDFNQADSDSGRYKIRIETGWGRKISPFEWENHVEIDNGSIISADPCFRGQSVLAPKEGVSHSDDVNKLDNRIVSGDSKSIRWKCTTFKNPSTRHSATCSLVIEIEGSSETRLKVLINDKLVEVQIKDLIEGGISGHMNDYNSEAYLIHKAVPKSAYDFELICEADSRAGDFFHAEVHQVNGQSAWISPVYIK